VVGQGDLFISTLVACSNIWTTGEVSYLLESSGESKGHTERYYALYEQSMKVVKGSDFLEFDVRVFGQFFVWETLPTESIKKIGRTQGTSLCTLFSAFILPECRLHPRLTAVTLIGAIFVAPKWYSNTGFHTNLLPVANQTSNIPDLNLV